MSLEGQLLGRYRLLQGIGSGGMGEVYLAEDPSINRQVAIKVIRTEMASYSETDGTPGANRLFQREARAIAMLDHPNILPLYDYGEQNIQGATLAYLVMPYRSEGSLAGWLHQRNSTKLPSFQDVEQMVRQAASALQYAHDHALVHQDVKASNFLLRNNKDNPNRPDLLLTDFGIAKLNTMTSGASQSIRGTPTSMAPEQWEGHPVPATDQYALAVMIYEILTGRPPFQGNPMQMMYAHVHTQPPAPSSFNPRLSPQIDAVILRALAKKPAERLPSISEFATAFQQAIQSVDSTTAVRAAGPDASTFIKTPSTPSSGDLYATLAISEQEAQTGATRILTLPGGRKVTVSIPAGVHDGDSQVINLRDQDVSTSHAAPADRLHLTFSVVRTVKETEAPSHLTGIPTVLRNDASSSTVLTDHERTAPPTNDGTATLARDYEPTIYNAARQLSNRGTPDEFMLAPVAGFSSTPVESGAMPYHAERAIPGERRTPSTGKVILFVGVVLLLILTSAGLGAFYYFGGSQSNSQPDGSATAVAQFNIAASATAQTNATLGTSNDKTATAQTNTTNHNATATAQGNATATTDAQHNATNATATAQAIATITAQNNANATATAQANSTANPYPPYSGTLTLNDSLSSNNYSWDISNDSVGNSCQFTGGAYHVIRPSNYGGPCFARATDFTNFTYQVQMTFVRAGQSFDGGGIVMRGNGDRYYYFEIFESGKYVFGVCVGNDCSTALAEDLSHGIASFHSGLNQTNTIAVVANNNSFDLYVNGQHLVGPVTDSKSVSSHGTIGVYGTAYDTTTEVVYSNAKVWV